MIFFWSVKLDSQKHNLDYVILCSQNFNLFLIGKKCKKRNKIFFSCEPFTRLKFRVRECHVVDHLSLPHSHWASNFLPTFLLLRFYLSDCLCESLQAHREINHFRTCTSGVEMTNYRILASWDYFLRKAFQLYTYPWASFSRFPFLSITLWQIKQMKKLSQNSTALQRVWLLNKIYYSKFPT